MQRIHMERRKTDGERIQRKHKRSRQDRKTQRAETGINGREKIKMVHTEYIGARMRYRAEQRARRRKHALTIMRNICGVAAFVFFMLVLGKAGASDCGAAWEEIFPSTLYFTAGFVVSVLAVEWLERLR